MSGEHFLTFAGSFPLENTRENMLRCLEDIFSIPINYPNYVQLEDMNRQFLDPLSNLDIGLARDGDRYIHIDDLREPESPIAVEPLSQLIEFIEERNLGDKVGGVRACVTGPFTLSSRIEKEGLGGKIFGRAILSDIELVSQTARLVAKIAYFYQERGATLINIDEPILSVIIGKHFFFKGYTESNVIEILNETIGRVGTLKGIHVCGRLSPRLREILLQTEFNVLDHEFYDIRENLDVYTRRELDRSDKRISFGSVSSKNTRVEPEDEIKAFLQEGIETFGSENILFFKPDCGFRGLFDPGLSHEEVYRITIQKLRNLKRAIDRL
ncbi:MAG: hypothetical protein ACE5GD_04420 [Candidatus Geothermarchaeales archaeon]